MNWRKSVALTSLKRPFRKALELAAHLGASGIEIDGRAELPLADLTQTGVRQIRKWLSDYRLQIASVRFPTRRGLHVLDDLDRRLDAIRRAMNRTAALGCPYVSLHLNGWPTGDPDGLATLSSALQDLVAHSLRSGSWPLLRVAAEPIGEVRQLLERLPEEATGVDFDPADLLIHGQKPLDAVVELGRAIRHVRIRDAARDSRQQRGLEVQIGRGEIDFPELLGALEEHHYRGYLTVAATTTTADPVQEIQQAFEFLDHIVA